GLADEAFTTTTTTTTTTTVGAYILSNDRPETKYKLSKLAHEEGIKSFICLPLTSHANRLGVIYFYRADRDMFTPDEIELLTTCAHLAAEAIENARLYGQTKEQARTDALTGLYNRREFELRLAEEHRRAARYAKPYALMMLDIDHFKQINDTYGHPAGDAVLKTLADILRKQLRDVDVAARYGGEEFVVVFPEIGGGAAKPVAERVRRAVAATPFRLPDGREIGVTVSIGVSCYPNCAGTPQEVVDRADQALYVAKEAGRNRVVLYRELLKAQIEKNPARIVELLNDGLENIQPIVTAVDTKTAFFRDHSQCTHDYAMRLGRALGLGKTERETLKRAALLHDVGIIAIPDTVLNKDSALTEEEWRIVKQHPVTAAALLERVPALRPAVPAVRHHHERWDGRGYPDGLKGEAIPHLARVLAVADVWCALTADRPQRRAYGKREAMNLIAEGAGREFDPGIVAAFVTALDALEKKTS
ncbi:MAG: diguanylate cyclase, partial [Gammaproteobacteria bacterium]|nr:diguanylate cyclase [Gammaproteobacteria bacterium]